jgi:hypothetical protein
MANSLAEAAGVSVVGRESKEKHPPIPSKRGWGRRRECIQTHLMLFLDIPHYPQLQKD